MDEKPTGVVQSTNSERHSISPGDMAASISGSTPRPGSGYVLCAYGDIQTPEPDSVDHLRPTGLRDALDGIMSLAIIGEDKSRTPSWAVLYNMKSRQSLSIIRISDGLWQFSTPVFTEYDKVRRAHMAQLDAMQAGSTLSMFFAGDNWYDFGRFGFNSHQYLVGLLAPMMPDSGYYMIDLMYGKRVSRYIVRPNDYEQTTILVDLQYVPGNILVDMHDPDEIHTHVLKETGEYRNILTEETYVSISMYREGRVESKDDLRLLLELDKSASVTDEAFEEWLAEMESLYERTFGNT